VRAQYTPSAREGSRGYRLLRVLKVLMVLKVLGSSEFNWFFVRSSASNLQNLVEPAEQAP
jgi:hypothetical protein